MVLSSSRRHCMLELQLTFQELSSHIVTLEAVPVS